MNADYCVDSLLNEINDSNNYCVRRHFSEIEENKPIKIVTIHEQHNFLSQSIIVVLDGSNLKFDRNVRDARMNCNFIFAFNSPLNNSRYFLLLQKLVNNPSGTAYLTFSPPRSDDNENDHFQGNSSEHPNFHFSFQKNASYLTVD